MTKNKIYLFIIILLKMLNPFLDKLQETEKKIDVLIDAVNENNKKIILIAPSKLRGNNAIFDTYSRKQEEIKNGLIEMETHIGIIKNKLNELYNTIENGKKILNERIVGTLQGHVRGSISENNITTDNEFINNIIDQPYDESAEIYKNKRGGKIKTNHKKRFKKNNTKKRKI